MSGPLLGCIADDHTGATDLASMLMRAGLRVIQIFGVGDDRAASPAAAAAFIAAGGERDTTTREAIAAADAVVIALKTRSIAAADAVRESCAALQLLRQFGVERFFFKYCSTFDSTAEGNIGPVAEMLAEQLKVDRLWHCPSFPENGRTVYFGHLFVHGVPLAESGMREHPLNPMTDSNLVRVLQAQCDGEVGLLDWHRLQDSPPAGQSHLQAAGARHWIVDAISNDDLAHIAKLAADHRLLCGGSAIARYWAAELLQQTAAGSRRLRRELRCATAVRSDLASASRNGELTAVSLPQTVILAGSCSVATRQQIADFATQGQVFELKIAAAAQSPEGLDEVAEDAYRWCQSQGDQTAVLLTSSWDPDAVSETIRSLGRHQATRTAELLFAAIAKRLVGAGLRRLVVAGGETSGVVIQALGVRTVRIGREIAPGVPWVHWLGPTRLSLALKSGNFGGPTFFRDTVASGDDACCVGEAE